MGDRAAIGAASDAVGELRLLGAVCERWVQAFHALPERLRSTVASLTEIASHTGGDVAERARHAQTELSGALAIVAQDGYDPASLEGLPSTVAALVSLEKQDPRHREPGSIYSHLHSRLENLVYFIPEGPGDIAERSRSWLERHPEHVVTGDLRRRVDELRKAALARDGSAIEAAAEGVQAALRTVEDRPAFRRRPLAIPARSTAWLLLAIEDDPVWMNAVRRSVEILATQLSPAYSIEVEAHCDATSARERIQRLPRRSGGGPASRGVVAVLDLGLPADASPQALPSRNEGLALLEMLRSPRVNLPVIVLTTAPNFLADHLAAAEQGVSDYLLKDADAESRLVSSLARIVSAREERTLRLLHETGRVVVVDDVEIALDPHLFRTLAILADEAPSPVPVDALQERLGAIEIPGPDEYTLDDSLRINWQEARRQTSSPMEAARWLHSNRFRLWKHLRDKLAREGIESEDVASMSRLLDAPSSEGTHRVAGPSPSRMEKYIYEARSAIKQAFSSVGRTIVPEEEVIANAVCGARFAYRIAARVISDDELGRPMSRPFRILIVEDDIEGWQKPLAALLERFGYEVAAAGSVEEGIDAGRVFRPDLLCLDMHMPLSANATTQGRVAGWAMDGGLRVLQALSSDLPLVRALVFTDLADVDALRVRAAELGVRVSDFLSKGPDPRIPWDVRLILQVHRIEQEVARQSTLPLPDLPCLPYIRLWESRRNPGYVEVFDRPWKLSPNQFRLLWTLAGRANRPVPTDLLMEEVYGDTSQAEALKQLVKNFRKRIAKEALDWFELSDPEAGRRAAESILASDARAGYVLNARVVIE